MAVRGTSDAVQAVPVREILNGVKGVRDAWGGLTAAERARVPQGLRASMLDLIGIVKTHQDHLGDVIPPAAGGGDVGETMASQAVLIGTMPDQIKVVESFPAPVDNTPSVIDGDPVVRERDQEPVVEPMPEPSGEAGAPGAP